MIPSFFHGMDTSHAGSAHADMGGLGLFTTDDGTPGAA